MYLSMGPVELVFSVAFTSVLYMILCFLQLYIWSSLNDLEGDIVVPSDVCRQLNPAYITTLILHLLAMVVSIVSKRWLSLVISLPVAALNVYKLWKKSFFLNEETVRRTATLHEHTVYCGKRLKYYIILFALSASTFVFDLVRHFTTKTS
ncbi:putative Cornichon protein [Monocercomonoides exilis]|uniref:putative Cornichon protein n=1 Tax=Monocercomonoides exilis TaxID=2049356 RepID=UPI003559A3EF|nr:putative Cornichon protein [Monocercomonoides exilis]|eukprot:MONOS_12474.1-p1 / transcript=MONOS_12474.1 / gene=MONOS_12474 / organism=Monocercomonoides_exilis_PA203 / gene_product=unspecified product / transcript_product=unspecified product / location=Mono_scaffold00693:32207-32713(+) / protein_length=149 / sequence_SO=supercontig / SO=protein_coding / is_pseudo=false